MNAQIEMIEQYYNQGCSRVTIVRENGNRETLRLFVSTCGELCYKAKGSKRRGYRLNSFDLLGVIQVKPIYEKKLTAIEKYVDNIRRFKAAFTQKCHANLWQNLQEGYTKFDVTAFEKYLTEQKPNENSGLSKCDCLCSFCKEQGEIHVITENHYKTTTLTSNKPTCYDAQYEQCLKNIAGHLDRKEDFHYYWRGSYDVSVSGKMCDYGPDSKETGYKAWLNLEYKNCGNGHYYLLINENLAVFAEDD